MHVRVDYVADRCVGGGADGLFQVAADFDRASDINHGAAVSADNEFDVGNVITCLRINGFVFANMNVSALGDSSMDRATCGRTS